MGIDVSKLTSAEALKALEDGKITYEELKGLSEAEQAELANALGGLKMEAGDVLDVKTGQIEKAKEEKPGLLKRLKKEWDDMSLLGKIATGVAGVAVVAAGGYGLVSLIGGAKAAMAGIGVLAVGGLFAACGKDNDLPVYQGQGVNVQQHATVNVDASTTIIYESPISAQDVQAILELLQDLANAVNGIGSDVSDIASNVAALSEKVTNIVNTLLNFGLSLDQIIRLLEINNMSLDQINQQLIANGKTLGDLAEGQEDIKNLLNIISTKLNVVAANQQQSMRLLSLIYVQLMGMRNDNNNNHAHMIELLNAILNKIGEMDENQASRYNKLLTMLGDIDANRQNEAAEIIARLDALGVDVQTGTAAILAQMGNDSAKLGQIIALLNNLNNLGAQIKGGITNLLAAVNNMDANMQGGIAQILAEMNTMDTHQRNGINLILAKMNTAEANQQARLAAILAKMGDMDAHNNANAYAILAKLNQMNTAQQNAFLDILGAVGTVNNNMATITANQMTQIQSLADILAAIQAGNTTMSNGNALLVEIKDLIEGLNLGGATVDLDTIEELLRQILARENANGDILNNINNNTALINATVNQLKTEVTNLRSTVASFSQQNHDDLMAILNAIPTDLSTCNCDCVRIIELLEEISERLSSGDYNHEGYRDDYGDILG